MCGGAQALRALTRRRKAIESNKPAHFANLQMAAAL
jgi:hypothetical protein